MTIDIDIKQQLSSLQACRRTDCVLYWGLVGLKHFAAWRELLVGEDGSHYSTTYYGEH